MANLQFLGAALVHAGPERNEDTEILVVESTYGNPAHPHDDVRPHLAEIISRTVQRGGSVGEVWGFCAKSGAFFKRYSATHSFGPCIPSPNPRVF